MVIMALIPKAVDNSPIRSDEGSERSSEPLAIATPETLPEAIEGRPYTLALAATGARGPVRWALDGPIPEGLALDPATGILSGTPKSGTPEPAALTIRASDGSNRAGRPTRLAIYQAEGMLTLPSRWKPSLPPIPWRAWMEQGFGFLVLILVHLVGLNTIHALRRWSLASRTEATEDERLALDRRFAAYRALVRLTTLAAASGLAVWLWWPRN
jgi:hypothetical protein